MNRKMVMTVAAAFAAGVASAAEPAATATVTVDPGTVLGPVKNMHAVNNGPTVKKPGGDQKCGNFEDYRAARLPFARYSEDDNVSDIGTVTFRVPGAKRGQVTCHLTDLVRTHTDVPVELDDDGVFRIRMMPLSFALVEVKLP